MRSSFKLLWVAVAIISVSACGGSSPKPATPTPSPAETPIPVAGTIIPGQVFDFAGIAPPDESNWLTYTGNAGTLKFKCPPDWLVSSSEIKDPTGRVIGDQFQIRKPVALSVKGGDGATASGAVEIQLSTQPFQVPYQPLDGTHAVRELNLQNARPNVSARNPAVIHVRQTDSSSAFPQYRGTILFTTPNTKIGGYYLNAFGTVDMDAAATDVAITRRIIESAEVLK